MRALRLACDNDERVATPTPPGLTWTRPPANARSCTSNVPVIAPAWSEAGNAAASGEVWIESRRATAQDCQRVTASAPVPTLRPCGTATLLARAGDAGGWRPRVSWLQFAQHRSEVRARVVVLR